MNPELGFRLKLLLVFGLWSSIEVFGWSVLVQPILLHISTALEKAQILFRSAMGLPLWHGGTISLLGNRLADGIISELWKVPASREP